jgi:hypothetical protein
MIIRLSRDLEAETRIQRSTGYTCNVEGSRNTPEWHWAAAVFAVCTSTLFDEAKRIQRAVLVR